MKTLLVLLAGILLGANLVYFAMTREAPRRPQAPVVAPPAGSPAGIEPGRAAASPPSRGPTTEASATPRQTRQATPAGPTASVAQPQPRPLPPTPPPGPGGLIVPVAGVRAAQLSDTFEDARSQGRVHEALDIMAPAGTPVLAAADGRVEKLFTSKQGGLTIYQFEPSGRYAYYYAHLQRYAEGIVEGKPLRQGEVIGYVGSTGNANPLAPHLHFAVFVLGPEKRWWKGTAIDPYPLLVSRG